MDYEEFITSRVEMTPTQYLMTYLNLESRDVLDDQVLKLYVYADGLYIEACTYGKFLVTVERSSNYYYSLEEAEKELWEEHAKYELGSY